MKAIRSLVAANWKMNGSRAGERGVVEAYSTRAGARWHVMSSYVRRTCIWICSGISA